MPSRAPYPGSGDPPKISWFWGDALAGRAKRATLVSMRCVWGVIVAMSLVGCGDDGGAHVLGQTEYLPLITGAPLAAGFEITLKQ